MTACAAGKPGSVKLSAGTALAGFDTSFLGEAMRRSLVIDAGLDTLQEFLLEMSPGDEVSAARAAQISGLDEHRCDAVLTALVQAGLMMRLQHDAYVRCRLQVARQQQST